MDTLLWLLEHLQYSQIWWHNGDDQNQSKRSQSFWLNVKHRGEAELAAAKGLDYQQTNSRIAHKSGRVFPQSWHLLVSGQAARQEGIPRQPAAQSALLQSFPLASRQPMGGPHRGKEIVMGVVKSCKLENRWTNKVIDGWRAKWQRRSCLIDDSWETGGSGAPLAPGAS